MSEKLLWSKNLRHFFDIIELAPMIVGLCRLESVFYRTTRWQAFTISYTVIYHTPIFQKTFNLPLELRQI